MELNQKLLKWAGLEWKWNHNPDCRCGAVDDDDSERSWYTPDGELATRFYHETIDFTNDLNLCFKLLVPLAIDKLADIDLSTSTEAYYKLFDMWLREAQGSMVNARTLCLVLERLIDEEKLHQQSIG